MEKFTTLEGVAAPLRIINVDTDMVIPKQYLKTIKRTGLGKGLFAEARYKDDGSENPDFVLNKPAYRKAKILVAGDNFGCGSSREHAPWALMDFGIRCIISTSFGDIFYNNCFKNGVLPIRVSPEDLEKLFDDAERGANATLSIDLEKQEIHGPDGGTVKFEIDSFRKHCMLNGLDDIGLTKRKHDKIVSYEEKAKADAAVGVTLTLGCRDRLGDRHRAPGHLGVQPLDHAAVDRHHALALVLRQFKRGDHLARPRHFVRARRERGVARLDLVGMDQRLAVEAEFDALPAFRHEAVGIADVVIDAVENDDAMDARGGDTGREPRQHRRAARHQARARVLGEIVGAHDEAGEPRFGIGGLGGDRQDVEDGERRLDHRPDPRLVVGAHVEQATADQLKRIGVRDFRHENGVGRGMGGGGEIVGMPGRIDAVDADEDLAVAEAAGFHRRRRPGRARLPWRRARPNPRGRE